MQLIAVCPKCEHALVERDVQPNSTLRCSHCDWMRTMDADAIQDGVPTRCLACGCHDLWRQKDFPARLGLLLVGLGALLSTIAWTMYEPLWAIGILMGFALFDIVLFVVMPDVLVCYRCAARHRHTNPGESIPRFDLEKAEQYRQEAARLREATGSGNPS